MKFEREVSSKQSVREDTLPHGYLPELGQDFYPGKVRDNHIYKDKRILVATDRISAFDRVLDRLIPQKGAILNAIAMWFFERCEDIIENHVIDWPDPNVIVAKEADPFPLEMVVRGYLTGSAWEDVKSGTFEKKYGFKIKKEMVEGKLAKNCKLTRPIVTPTTKAKEGHDLAVTEEGAKEVVGDVYDELREKSLRLFERGTELARDMGLILVDTKYEFGNFKGDLILIDEVHTPDSSRYWREEDYRAGPEPEELSKQFVRDIVIEKELTDKQVKETTDRYIRLYEKLCGVKWPNLQGPKSKLTMNQKELGYGPIRERIVKNLAQSGYIKGGFVQIIAGSKTDHWFVNQLTESLKERKIPYGAKVLSAHKNTGKLLSYLKQLNKSIEPVVAVTVAGNSDALSGVVAHHLNFPTIACPPHKDNIDYLINIHSGLQMPSLVPSMLVRKPANVSLACERILSLNNTAFRER